MLLKGNTWPANAQTLLHGPRQRRRHQSIRMMSLRIAIGRYSHFPAVWPPPQPLTFCEVCSAPPRSPLTASPGRSRSFSLTHAARLSRNHAWLMGLSHAEQYCFPRKKVHSYFVTVPCHAGLQSGSGRCLAAPCREYLQPIPLHFERRTQVIEIFTFSRSKSRWYGIC